ncbi:MAG TPA: pentapeptide repeat-containing protein, partial [Pseudonocardiaceae bacterium]|nr:pentapeptide repeat-containing protein [Pseudonocardiaceae bacterium]
GAAKGVAAPLTMARADLSGADLRRAVFHRVDLTGAELRGADLTTAELHGSQLRSVSLVGAQAIGTILRACAIDGTDITRANTYRTQVLRCTPAPESAPGLLVAPLPATSAQTAGDVSPLRPLTGHGGAVWAVAWSPEGTRLLTGSADTTARVWDASSGLPVGSLIVTLSDGEHAVFDAVTDRLVGASGGAWRWLGWNVVENGRLTRLPAESFGPLPPLHAAALSAEPA